MKVIALCVRFDDGPTLIMIFHRVAVVTLLIVNSDGFTPALFDSVFKTVGLDGISFIPQSSTIALSAWPTLEDMLSTNQRLVTFLDNGANFAVVPYLIDGKISLYSSSLLFWLDKVCDRVPQHLGNRFRCHRPQF